MDEQRCVLCEAYFRTNSMIEGKCPVCHQMYPSIKSRDELLRKNSPVRARTLTEETVQDIVYTILEEANIKRFKCEKCGKLYFRNSPAQKYCQVCKEKGDK
jgi:rubrerythrin